MAFVLGDENSVEMKIFHKENSGSAPQDLVQIGVLVIGSINLSNLGTYIAKGLGCCYRFFRFRALLRVLKLIFRKFFTISTV